MREVSGSPEGDTTDLGRRLIASAARVPFAHRISAHRHPRAQFLYSPNAPLRIAIEERSWIVAPGNGAWIPPLARHEIVARSSTDYRSVFITPQVSAALWPRSCALSVTAALRGLVDRTASAGPHRAPDTPESRIQGCLLDNLAHLGPANWVLPFPDEPRLSRVCDALFENPADDTSLHAWGRRYGASERTLARLFLQHTRGTFSQWRQQMVVADAIGRLAAGASVTHAAMDFGYRSPSAFTAMFKRITGLSPRAYMAALD